MILDHFFLNGRDNAHLILYTAALTLPKDRYVERYETLLHAYRQIMRGK